ncbi:MAG: AMP-binding protein [Desulfobacterales bacterium]|nr:AMP-binding protein [Desulfobacterales bacterium]
MELDTLPKLLKRNFERWGEQEVAFRDKDYGIWNEYTWKDAYENVKYFSLGLISLGLRPGERAAVIGDNEPQWYWASFAIQAARGITVALFTDAIPDEIQYIVDHSDSKFIVARDQEQVDKLLAIWDKLPKVEKVIWWYWKGMRKYEQPFIMSYEHVRELGKKYEESHPGAFEENIEAAKGDEIANIFYTSGTTGLPKGAMINHRALIGSAESLLTLCDINHKDNVLCYLPPAWVGEAFFTTVPHLITGAKLNTLEEPETVFHDITEITPTMILGGPRQWEGWVSKIRAKIDEAGSLEKFVYHRLMPVALKVGQAIVAGEKIPLWRRIVYRIVDWIFLDPIRDKLGLTRGRFAVTAGSVTGTDTTAFMNSLGVRLRQCYGSTEGGMISGHRSDDIQPSTVGPPLPGVEVRVAQDGEFLVRSPYFFSGYHKNREAYEKSVREGWWYSGDAGTIDEQGHLVYMDRVSELAQLGSGEKYAPQWIESSLRFSPYLKDSITIGEGRDFVTAIINMDYENVGRWAERNHIPYTTFTDLSQKAEVGKLVREDIDRVNRQLTPTTRIRKYVLLHKEFDPDEADLTRTRKLRRTAMEKRYGDVIEAMYSGKTGIPVVSEFTYEDGRKGTVSAELVIYSVEEQRDQNVKGE